MESHMAAVIFPGTSNTAGLIDFELNRFCLSRTQAYFTRQIHVACREIVIVYISIKSIFAAHDRVCMYLGDVVDRLPFQEKGADHRIEMFQFGFRNRKTGAGFRTGEFIFFLCVHCAVEPFFQSAVFLHITAVAYIGRPGEFPAGFLFVRDAGRKASAAEFAGPSGTVNAAGVAYLKDVTLKAQDTVMKGFAKSTGLFKDQMVSDFFGYGGAVLAKFPGDCFKGYRGIQGMFDYIVTFQI